METTTIPPRDEFFEYLTAFDGIVLEYRNSHSKNLVDRHEQIHVIHTLFSKNSVLGHLSGLSRPRFSLLVYLVLFFVGGGGSMDPQLVRRRIAQMRGKVHDKELANDTICTIILFETLIAEIALVYARSAELYCLKVCLAKSGVYIPAGVAERGLRFLRDHAFVYEQRVALHPDVADNCKHRCVECGTVFLGDRNEDDWCVCGSPWCNHILCLDCHDFLERCEGCDDYVCAKCLRMCEDCEDYVCTFCSCCCILCKSFTLCSTCFDNHAQKACSKCAREACGATMHVCQWCQVSLCADCIHECEACGASSVFCENCVSACEVCDKVVCVSDQPHHCNGKPDFKRQRREEAMN